MVPDAPVCQIQAGQAMTTGLTQIAPVPDSLVPGMEVPLLDFQPTPEAHHDAHLEEGTIGVGLALGGLALPD